ncbi:MAG: hypothetical protein AAFR61_08205 [Bacteroidota bacterium]
MKLLKTLCLIVLLPLGVLAQKEEDPLRNFTDHPDLFSFWQPEKSMLKFELLSLVEQYRNEQLMGRFLLGYEQKLNLRWSLHTEVSTFYQLDRNQGLIWGGSAQQKEVQVGIGPRYYFNLKKRVDAGESVDNLSANYLSIQLSSRMRRNERGIGGPTSEGAFYADNFSAHLLWGVQRRIFKHAYFDVAFGLRFAYGEALPNRWLFPLDIGPHWQFLPTSSIQFGLAL